MESFQSHTIFNSINTDALTPKARKPMPFPLENFENELADAYAQVDRIILKLNAALTNPVNHSPAKKRRLKALRYKTKTCAKLLKEVAAESAELWF